MTDMFKTVRDTDTVSTQTITIIRMKEIGCGMLKMVSSLYAYLASTLFIDIYTVYIQWRGFMDIFYDGRRLWQRGSEVSDGSRVHLLYLFSVLNDAVSMMTHEAARDTDKVCFHLPVSGLKSFARRYERGVLQEEYEVFTGYVIVVLLSLLERSSFLLFSLVASLLFWFPVFSPIVRLPLRQASEDHRPGWVRLRHFCGRQRRALRGTVFVEFVSSLRFGVPWSFISEIQR